MSGLFIERFDHVLQGDKIDVTGQLNSLAERMNDLEHPSGLKQYQAKE